MQRVVKKVYIPTLLVILSSAMYAGVGDYLTSSIEHAATRSITTTANNAIKKTSLGNILQGIGKSAGIGVQSIGNTVSVPTIAGLKVECDLPNTAIPDNISNLNFCRDIVGKTGEATASGLQKLLNFLLKGVSVGSCHLSYDMQQKCQKSIMQSVCEKLLGTTARTSSGSTSGSTVYISPVQTITSSAPEMERYGDRIIRQYTKDNGDCGDILPSSKNAKIMVKNRSLKDIYSSEFSPATVLTTGLRDAGASSIFSPEIKTWKECILTHPDHPEMCKVQNYRLPETYEDVQNDIEKTKIMLDDGLGKDTSFQDSALLANNYAEQCANAKDEAECEKQIYTNGYKVENPDGSYSLVKPQEVKEKKYEDIEKSMSYYANLLDAVDSNDQFYFMSESMAQTVPLSKRKIFRQKALEAMKRKALRASFIQSIINQKKEIVDIESNLIKVSASRFDSKKAIAEINDIISYFQKQEASIK